MSSKEIASYFQIVTFGSPTYGTRRSYYRNADNAVRDAQTLGGGSMTTVRVVECSSRADALDACISESRPVVWGR
jgi:hypothetical protein